MDKREYLSIAEFAKKAGVTRQTIYRKLSQELQPYVTERDNVKVIDIKALELFGVTGSDKDITATVTDFVTYFDEQNKTLSRLVDILEENNKELRAQLKIKDKQIEAGTRHLDQAHTLEAMTHAHALTGSTEEPVKADEVERKYKEMFDNSMQSVFDILQDYPEALQHLIENY